MNVFKILGLFYAVFSDFSIKICTCFSIKLLWAPVVDSVYWKRIGRRKSWMVPCQYLIGIFMLLLSYRVSEIMGDNESGKFSELEVNQASFQSWKPGKEFVRKSIQSVFVNIFVLVNSPDLFPDSKPPNVLLLMFLFLPLNFLAATQDIAVDGWALTMLSR